MVENYYEVRAGILASEYQAAKVELIKKECYAQGLLHEIANVAEDYFRHFNGKWTREYYLENLKMEYLARIIKVSVENWMDGIHICFYVGLTPELVCVTSRCTQKEKHLINEARRIWREYLYRDYFMDENKFIKINDELRSLKNGLEIVKELQFCFQLEDMIKGCSICKDRYLIQEHGDKKLMLGDFNIRKI